MTRIKSKHILKPGYEGKFMGVGLFILVIAAGSVTMYECSSNNQLPLLPSDTNSRQTASTPKQQPQSTPSQQPQSSPPQQTPSSNPQPSNDPPAPSQTPSDRNDLSTMRTTQLSVGNHVLYAWIAETELQREYGLMWVQPSEMSDNQGMLFVFDADQLDGFWMKNTLIPLDIAFIRDDGMVVDIQQMTPQSLDQHQPSTPYRYALEVNRGVFSQAGMQAGDLIRIPSDVLN